ncbi:MAG: AMP-binding protein [bacterium]|nr:long-chain fatty acid--CoA ligase [Gammaproteobacteria bacterium]HIL98312.1 long-chain fatty acid--CoA ligase [Pseudomonadales bacterium]
MNIASLLRKTATRFPSLTAVISGKTVHCNYQQLGRRVEGIAGYLRNELHHQPGDRVALIMKNCPEYIEVLLAVLHAGLAAVPINAKLHKNEFDYILRNSGASTLFITEDFVTLFPVCTSASVSDPTGGSDSVISVHSQQYSAMYEFPALPIQTCEPDDLAWLFYTSGTTGQPKGAMMSHRNLLVMTQSYFSSVDSIDAGDTLLHAAPMSHGSGLYIFPNIAKGAQQVVSRSDSFDAREIFELLQYHPRVSMFAAPTMIHRLVAADLPYDVKTSNLKSIIYGGGPMYVADIKSAMARFGNRFIQIYGQGETPMTITCLAKEDHLEREHMPLDDVLASVGTAQMPIELEIVNASGEVLPAGEVGEILVKGDTVMLGYWANPEATSETIVDGWLHTGDMGVLNQHGYLTLKDRSKDMIISGGTNIYPREVEEVLLQHKAVAEVAVVGKADPEWGETVIAFVVIATGHDLASEQCDDWCLNHMARFKRPKSYHFVDSLPKNNYGKVLKRELRQRL